MFCEFCFLTFDIHIIFFSMMRLREGERWPKILWRNTLIIMNVGRAINRYVGFVFSASSPFLCSVLELIHHFSKLKLLSCCFYPFIFLHRRFLNLFWVGSWFFDHTGCVIKFSTCQFWIGVVYYEPFSMT